MTTTRTEQRAGLDTPVRFMLAETDIDSILDTQKDFADRMGRVLWALIGILVSTTTAAVLLAMNLAVGR